MNIGLILIFTALIALVITAVLGMALIPYLHRLKFGQTILDIGPAWHKSKQGTPTMGGLMFIIGIPVAVLCGYIMLQYSEFGQIGSISEIRLFSSIGLALAYGAIGFLDDYIKVVKKQNMGLSARQKYLLQLIVCVCYLGLLNFFGDAATTVAIPFLGNIDIGILYYPLMVIVITGFVNAVNLTDGIDGLASTVTLVYAIVMIVIAGILHLTQTSMIAAALAGGCLGFLIWNFYPAKVFMGDTGSMFLGGLVVALAFETGMPLLLIFTGVIYWMEAFSVMLQVASYKTRKKRIFKMSPIHHHFEMSGYSEIKIVVVFSIVGLAGGLLGALAVLVK